MAVLFCLGSLFTYADDKDVDLKDAVNFIFGDPTVTCDMEANPACQNFSIREIYESLEADYKKNVSLYQKQYLCVIGVVKSVSADGAKLEVTDPDASQYLITAKTSGDKVKTQVKKLKTGDRVRLLGKVTVTNVLKKNVTMEITWVEPTTRTETPGSTVMSFASGRNYDTKLSPGRSMADGAITFCIPSAWEGVEEEISGTGMNGWMYRLNEIPTDYKTRPEQVYVFYFDNESGLRNSTDVDRDEVDIEQAIICNIMDKDLEKLRSIRRENGPKFTYYRGNYKDSAGRYNNVEFICTALEKKGIFCVMYIYDTADHCEDIIYLLRTAEKK